MQTSFIRYMGGANKIIGKILPHFPGNFKEYREPMIGSGIVLLGMLQNKKRPDKIKIGDLNYSIYNMWNHVLNNTEELERCIKLFTSKLIKSNDLEDLKIKFNEVNLLEPNDVRVAAIDILKNRVTTFGNFGSYLSFEDSMERLNNVEYFKYRLFGTANLVGEVDLRQSDYSWALEEGGEDVLVFLDPPFYNVSVKEGYYIDHNKFDFYRLKREMEKSKHKILMRIDVSEFSESFKDSSGFDVVEIDVFYGASGKWTKEHLIKNY